MSQAARKIVTAVPIAAEPPAQTAQPSFARLANPEDAYFDSPALELQSRLGEAVQFETPPKWSYRKTASFLVVVNGAFWLAVGLLVAKLV